MAIQIPTSGNNPTTTTPPQQTEIQQPIVENTEQGQSQTPPVTEQPQPANTEKRLDGVVYIVDENVPIIVLYGPTSCGKSMTLVRMTNYLRSLGGYAVTPDRTFRPSDDKDYQTDCDNFDAFVTNPMAAPPTTGYMLVDVIEGDNLVCKILEAPGEYYFNPKEPHKSYRNYLNKIIQSPNQKIWCIFVEKTNVRQSLYVNRVVDMGENGFIPSMQTTDSVVVLFNKIDKTGFSKSPGEWNEKKAKEYVDTWYPGLFNAFKEDIPIVKWFRPYKCHFEPFCTGKFNEGEPYAESKRDWPERFWKKIKKLL